MPKHIVKDSDDEEEQAELESPPLKWTRIVQKPSQWQADISKLGLLAWVIQLYLNAYLQFTDKENQETEQTKIAHIEKEIARLKRKNKKGAKGMLFVCHYKPIANL